MEAARRQKVLRTRRGALYGFPLAQLPARVAASWLTEGV
jgi:hypothetical protein